MTAIDKVSKDNKILTYLRKSLNILLIAQSLSLSPLYRAMNEEEQIKLIEHLRDRTNYKTSPFKQQLVKWVKTGDLR
jgi:ribonucleotide reductase beta subunit family protein with ferritin-like domain